MSEAAKVTLVLPKELWEEVKRLVPSGQRSRLVAEAIDSEVRRRKRAANLTELKKFHKHMLAKYGELPSSANEIESIRQERDDELTRLR